MKKPRLFILSFLCLLSACQSEQSNLVDSTVEPTSEHSSAEHKAAAKTRLESMHDPASPGASIYEQNCAHCHNGTVPKAPHIVWLSMLSPKKIYTALNSGVMKVQAAALSDDQRREVAEYLTQRKIDDTANIAYAPQCDATRSGLDPKPQPKKRAGGTIRPGLFQRMSQS